MSNMLRRLWNDDQGAVVSVELVLIIGIVLFGIIPGLVALRNGVNAALGTIANVIQGIVPNFTYSGWFFTGGTSGTTIAAVGGYSLTTVSTTYLTAGQTAPTDMTGMAYIPPSP